VSAIGVYGIPPDQFAFLEDADDHLNVVVAHANDVVTLLRIPLSDFSDGGVDAPSWHYRPIAHAPGSWLTTRFVGPYVIVGARGWDGQERAPRTVVVTAWAGETTYALTLTHDTQRIDAIGAHAVVIGGDRSRLSMTAVRLGAQPRVAGTLVQADALQSEDRSHAFFYRQDGPDAGVFGFPIVTVTTGEDGDARERSARILFIANRALAFSGEGTLDASSGTSVDDDRCRVSCLDWYGNARPIFIDDRIFALLGYEIVEGRLVGGHIEGVRRLDFTPRELAFKF